MQSWKSDPFDWPKFWGDCHGRWADILMSLGLDRSYLSGQLGPCPICGGKDRYHWSNDDIGYGRCSQCGVPKLSAWTIAEHLTGLKSRALAERISPGLSTYTPAPPQEAVDKKAVMREWLQQAKRLTVGDAGHAYLSSRCAPLKMSTLKDFWLHPGLKLDGEKYRAIIAVTRDAETFAPCGVQRVFLAADGRKITKKTYGVTASGVCLGAAGATEIVVGEGIETTLCAMRRFGLPGWAALSDSGLASFIPPKIVTHVIIAGDNDPSAAGQKAAWTLANKLFLRKLPYTVEIPYDTGSDWADHHEFIE